VGRFYDLLDNSGDGYLVARRAIEMWLAEFKMEIGDTKDENLRQLLHVWLE